MKTFFINNLTFGYGPLPLFKDWSASIPAGVVLVRSEDSRGKTTLLGLLAGKLKPQSGNLNLDGITLTNAPDHDRPDFFYVLPATEEFDPITPMNFFARCKEKHAAFDERMMHALIEGFSLTPHQDKPIYMLSAGSKRKVWITAALASNARVTLIDDLTAALDKASIDFLSKQLTSLATTTNDRTIIVTHYEALGGVPFSFVIDI